MMERYVEERREATKAEAYQADIDEIRSRMKPGNKASPAQWAHMEAELKRLYDEQSKAKEMADSAGALKWVAQAKVEEAKKAGEAKAEGQRRVTAFMGLKEANRIPMSGMEVAAYTRALTSGEITPEQAFDHLAASRKPKKAEDEPPSDPAKLVADLKSWNVYEPGDESLDYKNLASKWTAASRGEIKGTQAAPARTAASEAKEKADERAGKQKRIDDLRAAATEARSAENKARDRHEWAEDADKPGLLVEAKKQAKRADDYEAEMDSLIAEGKATPATKDPAASAPLDVAAARAIFDREVRARGIDPKSPEARQLAQDIKDGKVR